MKQPFLPFSRESKVRGIGKQTFCRNTLVSNIPLCKIIQEVLFFSIFNACVTIRKHF